VTLDPLTIDLRCDAPDEPGPCDTEFIPPGPPLGDGERGGFPHGTWQSPGFSDPA
jgi:hypothetical protein